MVWQVQLKLTPFAFDVAARQDDHHLVRQNNMNRWEPIIATPFLIEYLATFGNILYNIFSDALANSEVSVVQAQTKGFECMIYKSNMINKI